MALPNKNFFGTIEGRNIYSFLADLNYDLKTSAERVEHLRKTLSDGNGRMHPFFERIFEQTQDETTKLNTSYIKLILNSTDGLYSDTNVCEVLTKLTDYILFAEDMRELERANRTEYKIYKDEVLFKKMMREVSLEAELDKISDGDDEKDIDNLIHILVKDKNFRKEAGQVIYKQDFEDMELKDVLTAYQSQIDFMNEKLSKNKERLPLLEAIIDSNENEADMGFKIVLETAGVESKEEAQKLKIELVRENKNLIKHIGLMKCDLLDAKDMIKKPIRFKHLMSGSSKGDYTDVDFGFGSEEIIKNLLVYPEQETYDLQNEFEMCQYIVRQLIEMTEFTVEEEQVLYLHQHGYSQKYIAEECSRLFGEEYIQQEVSRCLDDIVNKLVTTYETFYNKYLVKNNLINEAGLKTCSKCGETKYRGYFDKDSSKKDGLKSQCKECRK